MNKTQKITLFILIGISIFYFCLFIFPNSTGAKNPSMISLFEPDEFAQYPFPKNMLSSDGDFIKTAYHFIAYDHYYYGFPFYLKSVIVLFPIWVANGLSNRATQTAMLVLRQFVSVLPMILAIFLVVYSQTRLKEFWKSIISFVILLSIPAVVENNMWWHPESLLTFFVVLTLFFLMQDRLEFKKFFFLAAVASGLAIGTKIVGLFFFLTIPTYVAIGYIQKKLSLPAALLRCGQFLGIMALSVVLSNPYLLIPSEFAQMVDIMTRQGTLQSQGWTLQYSRGPGSWLSIIEELYGFLPFLLIMIGFIVNQVRKQEKKVNSLLLLTWISPLTLYILFVVAIKPTHFFLPIVIPLFLVMPDMLRSIEKSLRESIHKKKIQSIADGFWLLFLIFLAYQVGSYWVTDYHLYTKTLIREETNSSIAFYSEFEDNCLSKLPDSPEKVDVLRDVRVYFPNRSGFRIQSFFTTTNYDIVAKKNPELLVLWNQRINDYTRDEDTIKSVDPITYKEIHRFFMDAKNNSVSGYKLISESESVKVFARNEFLNKTAGICVEE